MKQSFNLKCSLYYLTITCNLLKDILQATFSITSKTKCCVNEWGNLSGKYIMLKINGKVVLPLLWGCISKVS